MYNDSQTPIFTITSVAFNVLSCIGCIPVFYSYFRAWDRKTAPLKMLTNLILSDFLISIIGIVRSLTYEENTTCSVNLTLTIMGYWSATFWSITIAIFSYRALLTAQNFVQDQFYRQTLFLWVIICILIPLIPMLNISGLRYTSEHGFCSVSFLASQQMLYMVIQVVPFILNAFVTLGSYIKQAFELNKIPQPVLNSMKITVSKLLWYPFGQLCAFIPSLLFQLIFVMFPYKSDILDSIRLYSYHTAGFIVSVLYGVQKYKNYDVTCGLVDTDSPKIRIPFVSSSDDEEDESP